MPQKKLAFNVTYSIGILTYDQVDTLALKFFKAANDNYPKGNGVFYSSWLQQSISGGAEYAVFPFLHSGIDLSLNRLIYYKSDRDHRPINTFVDFELARFSIQPRIGFDALYKSKNKALRLNLGLSIFYQYSTEIYGTTADTGSFENLSSLKINRSAWATNYFLDLEWEKYYPNNFGYSIGFRFVPSYTWTPNYWKEKTIFLKMKRLGLHE